jgi:ADP-heptose:LPS heptosyltransferase
MLRNAGMQLVYGLKDSYKYEYSELLDDNLTAKDAYIGKSESVLLEIYGNIGDTILPYGIVCDFMSLYGKANVWLLVETEANAEAYRAVTGQIIVFSADDCSRFPEKRKQIISKINNLGFKKSIVLTDIRLYAVRRWLNDLNFLNTDVICDDTVPQEEYLPDLEEKFAAGQLGKTQAQISKVKAIWKNLSLPDWRAKLSEEEKNLIGNRKLVAVHMGATKPIRMYDPQRTAPVIEYILSKGYLPVIIGAGKGDEDFWKRVFSKSLLSDDVVYMVSRLTVRESMSVIYDSEIFLGTDSGMWNLSYILDKPSVVIYGGGEYGNFMHNVSKIHYVTVKDKSCFQCKWYCSNYDESGHAKCIYDITEKDIISAIEDAIKAL